MKYVDSDSEMESNRNSKSRLSKRKKKKQYASESEKDLPGKRKKTKAYSKKSKSLKLKNRGQPNTKSTDKSNSKKRHVCDSDSSDLDLDNKSKDDCNGWNKSTSPTLGNRRPCYVKDGNKVHVTRSKVTHGEESDGFTNNDNAETRSSSRSLRKTARNNQRGRNYEVSMNRNSLILCI